MTNTILIVEDEARQAALLADYLAAALGADAAATTVHRVTGPGLAAESLPDGGLVALRSLPSAADAARLAAWVRHGGALWGERVTQGGRGDVLRGPR